MPSMFYIRSRPLRGLGSIGLHLFDFPKVAFLNIIGRSYRILSKTDITLSDVISCIPVYRYKVHAKRI